MGQLKIDCDLAVVIVNYEQPLDTIECIHSIRKSYFSSFRVVLVDNGSKDDSLEKLSREFPDLEPIIIPDNIKFTGGHNTGILHALETGATHIFVLNNDTVIEPSTIQELYDAQWDVRIPKILYYDHPEVVWSAGARWRKFPPSVKMIGHNHPDGTIYNKPGSLSYATGCALLATREVFERTGLFDTNFGNYMEDYDFFYRVNAAGFTTGYVPTAKVFHKVSRTLGKHPPSQRFFMGRNTILFYLKDRRYPIWILWCYVLWVQLREIFKGNITHLPDYWNGYRDGFKWIREH
jgi:GT2 family glycosyltransferase